MSKCSAPQEALALVEQQGVVLVSAKGPALRLTEAIVGAPINGSWWAHPESHHIFSIVEAVSNAEQVLVCRLNNGKLTLVHRRFWPALVRVAGRIVPAQLSRVLQEHTPSGRHINHETPFPERVPPEIAGQARVLEESVAHATIGRWLRSTK